MKDHITEFNLFKLKSLVGKRRLIIVGLTGHLSLLGVEVDSTCSKCGNDEERLYFLEKCEKLGFKKF